MSRPRDDHEAAVAGESLLDAMPGTVVDEQTVP
jgi:hypothetical protein